MENRVRFLRCLVTFLDAIKNILLLNNPDDKCEARADRNMGEQAFIRTYLNFDSANIRFFG